MNSELDARSRQLSLVDLEEYTVDGTVDLFRPIQYLGSKMRVVDFIAAQVQQTEPQPQGVWDIFAGSTVVAQALAQRGYSVTATDAMGHSVVFARALLGCYGRQYLLRIAVMSDGLDGEPGDREVMRLERSSSPATTAIYGE